MWGGTTRRWVTHQSTIRNVMMLLNELWEFSRRHRHNHYFFETVPDEGPRAIRPIQGERVAVALANLGRTVALINIYIVSQRGFRIGFEDAQENSTGEHSQADAL